MTMTIQALSATQIDDYARAFLDDVPGATAAVVLSTDGLVLAAAGVSEEQADRMAAVAASLLGLGVSVSVQFDLDAVTHTLIAYTAGTLALMAVNGRCALAVLADTAADLGNVVYEMGLFGERHGDAITPNPRGRHLTLPERT